MSRPVYRGQAKASWELHSGAVQRLKELHGECILDDESKLRQLVSGYHRDLIYQMEILDGQRMLSWSGFPFSNIRERQPGYWTSRRVLW